MKKKKIIFLVDHKHRDFPSIALIGYFLEKKGHKVFFKRIHEPEVDIINPDVIKTNIIYFSLDHSKINSQLLLGKMLEKNIHFFELGPSWFRLVTHAGISQDDINFVIGEFDRILS